MPGEAWGKFSLADMVLVKQSLGILKGGSS